MTVGVSQSKIGSSWFKWDILSKVRTSLKVQLEVGCRDQNMYIRTCMHAHIHAYMCFARDNWDSMPFALDASIAKV